MASLPSSYRRISLEQVDSTNIQALKAARQGEPGNLWVTATEQTAGVGRRGRAWSSDAGNLFSSLLLIDPAPQNKIGQLSLVAAVATHKAVCDVLPPHQRHDVKLKWPNDVLWAEQKISGILLESSMLASGQIAVVIGIGINCRKHPSTTDGFKAANLSQSGYDVDPDMLFERLAAHLDEQLTVWRSGEGMADIREDWLQRARGVGGPIVARLPNEEVHGTFLRLDGDGALVVGLENGAERVIFAGDVFWPGAIR